MLVEAPVRWLSNNFDFDKTVTSLRFTEVVCNLKSTVVFCPSSNEILFSVFSLNPVKETVML